MLKLFSLSFFFSFSFIIELLEKSFWKWFQLYRSSVSLEFTYGVDFVTCGVDFAIILIIKTL